MCEYVGGIFSLKDSHKVHTAVADVLLYPEVLNVQISDFTQSAPACDSDRRTCVAVDVDWNIKSQVLGNALHAEACSNSLRDTMELTFAAAQAENRVCNCIMLNAMPMVHEDPTTCASSGLTTTREVSIDVHIEDFIRGGVDRLVLPHAYFYTKRPCRFK